jgi:hypothetical protein
MEIEMLMLNLNAVLNYSIAVIEYVIEEVFFINGNLMIVYSI